MSKHSRWTFRHTENDINQGSLLSSEIGKPAGSFDSSLEAALRTTKLLLRDLLPLNCHRPEDQYSIPNGNTTPQSIALPQLKTLRNI